MNLLLFYVAISDLINYVIKLSKYFTAGFSTILFVNINFVINIMDSLFKEILKH
jgi:hypothetical protein